MLPPNVVAGEVDFEEARRVVNDGEGNDGSDFLVRVCARRQAAKEKE